MLHDVVQPLIPHDDGVQNGVLVVGVVILLEHRHAGFGVHDDGAGGGLQIPRQNPQKGGFSRSVGADDAIAVPLGEF